jgi:hypothetical protein
MYLFEKVSFVLACVKPRLRLGQKTQTRAIEVSRLD